MKKTAFKTGLVLSFCIILANAFGKTLNAKFSLRDTAKKSADTATNNPYGGKTFIFNQSLRVKSCANSVGDSVSSTGPIVLKGSRFTVMSVTSGGDLVISFWVWGIKSGQQTEELTSKVSGSSYEENKKYYEQQDRIMERKTFNFKKDADQPYAPSSIHALNDNRLFFVLTKSDFDKYCSPYVSVPSWDISFGILSTPFKLRFDKFSFTNNLSVGGAVYFQKKFNANSAFTWGFVVGLSLSSVSLDASSTNVYPDGTTDATKSTSSTSPLLTSTTRPAFTPSLHYLITYKNISFLVGGGFDFISKTTNKPTPTNPEAGWIYNGKPWLGIGFGISLFNNNSSSATTPVEGQSSSQ